MTKIVKPDFLKAFNVEKSILEWCGVYPIRNPKVKFRYARLTFCFLINCAQLGLMLMLLVVKDIDNFLEASHFIIISITFLFKLPLFVFGDKIMRKIENHLKSIDVSGIPMQIFDHVIKEDRTRNILYFPQRFMVLGGLAFQVVVCLILHKFRPVILISWSPFDLQDPKFYYPTLCFQTICFIMSGLPNTSMDITYYVLLDVACCEFDILMYKLMHLDTSRTSLQIEKDVRKYVIMHQEIISYINNVQALYANIIFVQCIGSVIVICFLGFQLAVTTEFPSGRFVTQGFFLASMIFQIFCYTWFGQKFLLKSSEVTDACFLSNWHECDVKIQKMLLNLMTRSVKPIVLHAGIFDLTLATFTGILRSSYSYMAVLNTMYG